MMIARRSLVAVLALLLAAAVVRNAVVRMFAETDPAAAERVWPDHPAAEMRLAMIAIAEAARQGQAAPPTALRRIFAASVKAPLAPEPFLVRGVQAQLEGNRNLAERAFFAARWRDGRSLPARYFLADHYLRQGDTRRGLREVATLARLTPQGVSKLAPFVAAYARNASNWPRLRSVFRSEPALEEATLSVLAADAANADLVLALADRGRAGPKSSWLGPLLSGLVSAGQYEKARDVWERIARVQVDRGALIYDPRFTRAEAPPPFNWTLTSSTVGLAERQKGGGLHVIYYGQEDGALASQLLILPPGRYRLTTQGGTPGPASALEWRLVCERGNAAIASVPLDRAIRRGFAFEVPGSCPAQRLELFGSSSDVSHQTEVTIRGVSLTREQSGD